MGKRELSLLRATTKEAVRELTDKIEELGMSQRDLGGALCFEGASMIVEAAGSEQAMDLLLSLIEEIEQQSRLRPGM